MVDASILQLRLTTSQVFGKQLDIKALEGLINIAVETYHEFGDFGEEGGLEPSQMDSNTQKSINFSRFKKLAEIAGKETTYYRDLFQSLKIDPAKIKKIEDIPVTPKDYLKNQPDAFVRFSKNPVHRGMSTGTTGRPTSVFHSDYELQAQTLNGALGLIVDKRIVPEDIVMNCNNARAYYGNETLLRACGYIGAICFVAGQIGAAGTIDFLLEKFNLKGKKPQISVIHTYSSYLGEIVEYGLEHNFKPSDFGLGLIMVGGEIVTEGLKQRTRKLFGEHVRFIEGYGMIEIGPFCATRCDQGHYHYEYAQGICEVHKMDSDRTANFGEIGRMVITPFPPYRETTIVLRYDTKDVVKLLKGPFHCSHKHLSTATTNILGRFRYCVKHDKGWTTPREIAEALEILEEVPLPARFGFKKAPGGVDVEVLARDNKARTRKLISSKLREYGVPLKRLHIVTEKNKLKQPLPLRCDLRDVTYEKGTR